MKLKIVNHKKFRKSLILSALIILGILFNIKNTASSEEAINYKTITVNSGDTLWSIAEYEQAQNEYYKNSDIRKVVSSIKQVNNLSSCNLVESQNLLIPTNL